NGHGPDVSRGPRLVIWRENRQRISEGRFAPTESVHLAFRRKGASRCAHLGLGCAALRAGIERKVKQIPHSTCGYVQDDESSERLGIPMHFLWMIKDLKVASNPNLRTSRRLGTPASLAQDDKRW